MWRLVGILGVVLGLLGCERAPEASRQMDNYLDRLGRVLDQPFQTWNPDQLSLYRMPERRQRLLDVPEIRLSLFDLLVESRRCPTLQQLVSERNSSLGKLMPASHILGFEGELLRSIDACLLVIDDDPGRATLEEQLREISRMKRDNLQATFWNALNGSPEFEQFLRFSSQPLPVSDATLTDHQAIQALTSLSVIGHALPETLPPDRSSLAPLFLALQRSDRSGQLIHNLARLTYTLDQATAMLRARPPDFLCPLGTVTPKSRILLTVFNTFYAGEVQPLMAQTQRLGLPWQQALDNLVLVQGIPPVAQNYLKRLIGEAGLWPRYQRSTQKHTEAWQDVLGACKLMPGQSGWHDIRTGV
ncbi:MAG TPA: DUF3080 family protein [Pseudomonas xinjiangensis]|uniref:DUF3080 family protein n=2 Tax=root TaxID=1 RepID=A0A7V1BR22_9GAMM|nr:DUF3080 family protein [Halopseudomonas xinjiangensis]HEC48769.1 DUF3080 family protein [Halopseudomonas xinjiangensis]